jgi:CheY-like chemotaxis protein
MKGRVLVIDDEAEIRRNLSVGLMQEDYEVVACPDGISAVHELNMAHEQGRSFDFLVTDIFMPDIDGLKILKVIKNQHPQLPVLVITGFGDEQLKFTALAEHNTAYLDKPFDIAELTRAMQELTPGATEESRAAGEQAASSSMRESISAYLTIRITDVQRSMDIFNRLHEMEGVQSCEAVRGDVDIIILGQAASEEGIQRLFDRVREVPGIEVVSESPVERPRLDRDVDEFIHVYEQEVKRQAQEGVARHTGTTSYVILDVEKEALQKIFTTVFFIDQILFCDVIDGGHKLVGMIQVPDSGNAARRIIEKLSAMEGVLRVREAKVIKLMEN